jgi:hypothetical protein
MLEILASVRACGDKPFATLEHLVIAHAPIVSGCICVFQNWDEARKSLVEKLCALRVPVLVLVIVPPGKSKLDAGPLRAAPDKFHVLEVGMIEEQLAKLS